LVGKYCNIEVVSATVVVVGSTGEGVGSVFGAGVVFNGDVVVGENTHPSSHSATNVMSIFPICEIFMVREDLYWRRGSG
jgi:hypothetical protein